MSHEEHVEKCTSKELKLTYHQKDLIKDGLSTHLVEGKIRSADAGMWIFRHIFSNYPNVKSVFKIRPSVPLSKLLTSSKVQHHAVRFGELLHTSVLTLNVGEVEFGESLVEMGRKHVKFQNGSGFKQDYWDGFAEAMLQYGNTWKIHPEPVRVETMEAWRVFVHYIVQKVRQGFQQQLLAAETKKGQTSSSID